MEYCENGDLHKKIKKKRSSNEYFTDNEIFDYFIQICLAIEYIHDRKILHRDLKTKNIFLTKGNLVKLGDFGVAKVLESSFELASTCTGSPYYISPEICENKPYNKKSDIWALGCILYELATLKYAFVAKNVKILITKITTGAFNPLQPNINTQIRSLIINLLKPNPKDRPTASEILNKPFLSKIKQRYVSENLSVSKNHTEGSKKFVKLNNEARFLSNSCTRLNNVGEKNRFTNITTPESKYNVNFFKNKLKFPRRYQPSISERRNSDGTGTDLKKEYQLNEIHEENRFREKSKCIKLPKVDSEYYNLIAETNRLRNNGECGKVNLESKCSDNEYENKEIKLCEEKRRKWMADTYEKKKLLTLLSEAELIDITSLKAPNVNFSDKERSNLTVDDMLKLDPSEMSEDILKPVKIENKIHFNWKTKDNYLNLLKQEIRQIKNKFEANDGQFQVTDLVKLTENGQKLLKKEIQRRKYLNDDDAEIINSDSVFFDLELKKMQLEKILGLNIFLTSYKKMLDILQVNIENDLEGGILKSGAETYVLHNEKEKIENMWIYIIEAFGSNQEHILEMWECAIYEIVYY